MDAYYNLTDEQMLETLEALHDKYNNTDFIEADPISIPHSFTDDRDKEIAGFLAATIAWGNRKAIVRSARRMMEYMDFAPYSFVMGAEQSDFVKITVFFLPVPCQSALAESNGDEIIAVLINVEAVVLDVLGAGSVCTKVRTVGGSEAKACTYKVNRSCYVFNVYPECDLPEVFCLQVDLSTPYRNGAGAEFGVFATVVKGSEETGNKDGIAHKKERKSENAEAVNGQFQKTLVIPDKNTG